jgi:hypothetical protein
MLAAVSISIAAPQTAEAQLRERVKKKVKDAIKPPEKRDPAPQPAAASPAAASTVEAPSSSRDPFANHRVPDARSLVISSDMLARVHRGLDAEAAMLKDLEKEIAAYPTRETIQACKVKASQTPEGQRLMNLGNFVKAGMTPEQTQAGMMKMTAESDAYYKKACPWDEFKWNDANRSDARASIRTQASTKSLLSTEADSAGEAKGLAGIPLNEGDFADVIERILKYCELRKTMNMSAKTGGIKVPGEGQDIYWIFMESELKALESFDCDAVRKKYAGQIGAYA